MSWTTPAGTSSAGLSATDTSKLATVAFGTQTIDIDIETGTYDANVTTGSNRDVRARLWSNSTDGEGRYVIEPLPGRTGGNVIVRLWTTLGASGSAGNKIAWKWTGASIGIGDTLAAALPNSQTVYQDVAAQTAHVLTAFDITVAAALFDQTKRFAMRLARLSSSDALDNYTGGSTYLHGIDILYTGWGPVASAVP